MDNTVKFKCLGFCPTCEYAQNNISHNIKDCRELMILQKLTRVQHLLEEERRTEIDTNTDITNVQIIDDSEPLTAETPKKKVKEVKEVKIK